MNASKLTHLIYTSAATREFSQSDLESMLAIARSNNARQSVTGMLLYTAGSFFQVLEGDEETLTVMFSHISSDPRHKSVTKIIHEPIAQRAFGDWTMGFSELAASDLETLEGFSDFFSHANPLLNLQPGRAKKLLSAFAQGRWRVRLAGNAG